MKRYAAIILVSLAIAAAADCRDSMAPDKKNGHPSLNKHADSIFAIGDTVHLTVSGDTANIIWVSQNADIAGVWQTGRVVGVSQGVTWVRVVGRDGYSDSAQIVVRQRLTSISVTPAVISRPLLRKQKFEA